MEHRSVICDICGREIQFDAGCRMGGYVEFTHTEIWENSFSNRSVTFDYCEGCYVAGRVGAFLDARLLSPAAGEKSSLGSAGFSYGVKPSDIPEAAGGKR